MLVSSNWLKELVSTNATPAQIADMLTMGGVEVEALEETRPDFEKVVVGHLQKVAPHPNADKLVLCEVNVGDPSPLEIVCGATNMKEGDKVPVAVVGAKLTGGLKVKKTKIRGETSAGMMCSERELGLGDDHSGIMVLPPDTNVGDPFEKAMGMDDVVLELGITPNRPDCLSMIGVAREVAAVAGAQAKPPEFEVPEEGPDIASLTSVTIDDPGGCPRYAARIVEGVTIGPSPLWMQQKLMKAGLRPLNNVVDITNYVLIELGHPLHAFDYNKLEENRIVVRRAQKGELIETLDGVKRELSDDMLVIADAQNAVAIAGVMGDASSEVTEQTTTVLIESAYFDPASIRRTSKALGLSTEASYRFERSADPEMAIRALDRSASLMAELAGGKTAAGRVDEYPRKIEFPEITLRYARINKIIGIDVPEDSVTTILSSLGFDIVSEESEALNVRVPTHRPDVTAEIDLIEEVARIHGYGKITATYPQDSTVMSRGLKPVAPEETCREVLIASGFSEVITYSFGAPSHMADFSAQRDDARSKPIKMKNPLTEDASVLRTTIIPGLLESMRTNANSGNRDLKLFETGKIFLPAPGDILPDEKMYVCAAATGLSRRIDWKGTPTEVDFFNLKGVAEKVIESMGLEGMQAAKAAHEGFHPGMCADITVGDKTIGKIGEIHPATLERYEIDQKVFLFEIDLDAAETGPKAEGRYEKFSRYPHAERDLAVVVDQEVEAAAVSAAIWRSGGDTLRDITLFDVYKGTQVGDRKKSLAFGLRFQSDERTLTDEEIAAASDTIVKILEERFDAKLRA
jgi:phenylalanyl-tRNA synthetase beta chain